MIPRTLTVAMIALTLMISASADHLPENKVALGESDAVLSGIDVHHTTIRQVIASLGQPTDTKILPEENGIAGGKQYVWNGAGVHLVVLTWNDKGDDSVPYSVEVSGIEPAGNVGITGRGLRLGATMADVQRAYGRRFARYRGDHGAFQVVIQWSDETTLRLHFNNAGRVIRMHLIAEIE